MKNAPVPSMLLRIVSTVALALAFSASSLAEKAENPVALVRIPATALDVPGGPAEWGDVWEVERELGWALLAVTPEEIGRLDAASIEWSWDWDKSRELHTTANLACYSTVEEIEQEIFALAAARPDLVQVFDYGDSWEKTVSGGIGGYDLWAVRLSSSETDERSKPSTFIMSSIHAREMATAEISLQLLRQLVTGYGVDPTITATLRESVVWIAPMTNPDGRKKAEEGLSWRKNTDGSNGCSSQNRYGVDLNRNSSWMWNHGGSSGNPCDETYRGPSAASEPEVAAIEDLFPAFWDRLDEPNDKVPADEANTRGLMVTIHSYSRWILRPLGYKRAASANEASLKAIGDRFADFTGYRSGVSSIALYIASGATDDVVYGLYGVPAFTFEVGNAFFESCEKLPGVVAANVNALKWGLGLSERPYRRVFGPELGVVSSLTVRAGDVARFELVAHQASASAAISEVRASLTDPAERSAGWIAGQPKDGNFDSIHEAATVEIDTTGMPPGRTLVWFEAISVDGIAGAPAAAWLTVTGPRSRRE